MKKSLIALAVLAASGASFAQSSVTLYGIADLWLGQQEVMGTQLKQTKIDSGGVSESRFGFKGSEDLGRGLKANFVLEQGFNLDSGSQGAAGAAFSRYAYIGFSGGFGEVKLGKTGTAYDDVSAAGNSGFDSALSAQNEVWLTHGTGTYQWNPANTIYYSTPTMSGFSGAASYSLGENKAPGVDAGAIASAHVKYAAGPIAAALAYQVDAINKSLPSNKFTRLNGSYNFGVVNLLAGYGRLTSASNETNEWELGVDYPVSAALTISGGIARSSDNTAAGDATREGYSLAANYTLSKRTSVYGGYRAATTKQSGVADQDGNLLAVGVKHTF